jgi:ribosomal protein L37E
MYTCDECGELNQQSTQCDHCGFDGLTPYEEE